jgi:hypothetical protein
MLEPCLEAMRPIPATSPPRSTSDRSLYDYLVDERGAS